MIGAFSILSLSNAVKREMVEEEERERKNEEKEEREGEGTAAEWKSARTGEWIGLRDRVGKQTAGPEM